MNFKAHDFTIFLLSESDGPHTKQKGHIQQYLWNSYAIRMIILTKKLWAEGLPAKREQAIKHIDVKNYSDTYRVNLEGQRTHNFQKI